MNVYTLARIELFAGEYLPDFSDEQMLLLENAHNLYDGDGLLRIEDNLSEELLGLVNRYGPEYRNFISTIDSEKVGDRVENALLYDEKFESEVQNLKKQLESKKPSDIPEYLGSGSNSSAFKVTIDGQDYAVKFCPSVVQMNFELEPLRMAKNLDNLSQLVAYSFRDSAVIMELLSGKNLAEFDSSTIPEYTDAELENLIRTIEMMDCHGLVLDPKQSNFMYDPDGGFYLLDYHPKTDNHFVSDSVIELPYPLTHIPGNKSFYDLSDEELTEYNQREYNSLLSRLKMTLRLLNVMNDKFPLIFDEALDRNIEMKRDSMSSTFEKGYFDREQLLDFANIYASSFSDKDDKFAEIESILNKIGSLGFF